MSRAEMECLVIPSLLIGFGIGLWGIMFVRAIRRSFRDAPPPEPWGSTDYAPEDYIPLDELYRRYPTDGKEE
jgi:hypothetical protein